MIGVRVSLDERQLDDERGAGALDALDADPPSVRLDDALGDGESKAGAGDLARRLGSVLTR